MMRQPIRKVKLFFPKLRDQEIPPTDKNTMSIDEQINDFIDEGYKIKENKDGSSSNNIRKMIDVKYSYQYIMTGVYEGEFERALLIYEEEV